MRLDSAIAVRGSILTIAWVRSVMLSIRTFRPENLLFVASSTKRSSSNEKNLAK